MARTKKEFNKEAMYKKIMPSMPRDVKESNEDTEVDDHNITKIDKKCIDLDKIYNIIEEKEENTFIVSEERESINFFEILILEKLDSVLERFKCCKCQECINDIVSVSLNNLPVYYFTGTKKEIEEALKEFKLSNNIDVVSEIIKAIISVRKKGSH